MAKLFLFAIGGTGSRVVKALSMLMASGVELKNTETIIPIIIDPDSANGDLTRTVEIIRSYKEIREKTISPHTNFFKTKISALDELEDERFVSDNFKFDIDGVKEQLFREFIGYSELDKKNQAFLSLLFSQSNLDANMEVGFKGNPNIGSVVLNKFKSSKFFQQFAANFEENDRVFIISSIFGGTGAAGFPLILKNIRDADHSLPNHVFLQNARIGAVTVKPYFSVDKNESTTVDSNTFISKTKAALYYYARNVSGNDSINALYYIGDPPINTQKGADGAGLQKNKAHFIELAAALSIIDFMSMPDNKLQTLKGKAIAPRYFEYGLKQESEHIRFNDLATASFDLVAKPLTKYALFKSFMQHHYDEYSAQRGQAFASNGNNKLTKNEIDGRLLDSLRQFNGRFDEWLDEMASSDVAFSPINFSKKGADIYNLVNDRPASIPFFKKVLKGAGLNHYLGLLNKQEPGFDHLASNQKLMALFEGVTNEIASKEIKL